MPNVSKYFFLINNEPIVETPFDALKTFINTNIDYLIIDNFLFSKGNHVSNLKDNKYFGYGLNNHISTQNYEPMFSHHETGKMINYKVDNDLF